MLRTSVLKNIIEVTTATPQAGIQGRRCVRQIDLLAYAVRVKIRALEVYGHPTGFPVALIGSVHP